MDDIWMGWLKRESGRSGYACMGDRGRAFGIYQFDYRFALIPFLQFCIARSAVYADFKPFAALGRGNAALVGNASLRAIWTAHAASQAFCDLQDEYARIQYYEPAAKYLKNLYGIDAAEHSAALRGSLFSFAIRSGQLVGARKFSSGGNTEEELLINAYSKYGNEDAGRWPEQLADALAALKEEENNMELTRASFLAKIAATAKEAKECGWTYGDSKTLPPCNDGLISCDRLISRTLYVYFGVTGQPAGGWNVDGLIANLPKHGFTAVKDPTTLGAGDVIIVSENGRPVHAFVLAAYNPSTGRCSKYDHGSTERIKAGGYFADVPLIEWSGRELYAAFTPTADIYPGKVKADIIRQGQAHSVEFTGHEIKVDGSRGSETRAQAFRVLRHAMNLDYFSGEMDESKGDTKLLTVAIGTHYVKRGEKQYMATAAEILLELRGIDPHGVEYPGKFGPGLAAAAGKDRIEAADFLAWCRE